MTMVKVGTFNIENLFNRYRLLDNEKGARTGKPVDPEKFISEGGHINMLGWSIDAFGPISKSAREATAKVISENDPDVLALQEVENLFALLAFNQKWLKNAYPYAMVIDGNDPRGIDVGVLSKYPLGSIRTYRFEPAGSPPNRRTFSRDCLEVQIIVSRTKPLTLFINHFKSKIGGGEERRTEQSARVAEILRERFGAGLKGDFIVTGDLNDGSTAASLSPLLNSKGLENVIAARLPEDDQCTHYYKRGKLAEQLDYVLLSGDLAKRSQDAIPSIERRGLGTDIEIYTGPRFSQVTGAQGASDHCGVFITITL